MSERMRESWQQFKESRPGNRFQDRYHHRRQSSGGRFDPRRLLYIVGGAVIAIASLFTAPLPGPGLGTFAIGLGMIAGEFLPGARFLDWSEVKLRELALTARDVWQELCVTGKFLVLLIALACAAALLYGTYYLLFG